MTGGRLILRSLRGHWRAHVGVVLGVLVASAVLTGALAVGDTLRYSLARQAQIRLGHVDQAIIAQDRFFQADLAGRLSGRLGAPTASVLQLPGVLSAEGGARRINDIQVLGVGERFATLAPAGGLTVPAPDHIAVSRRVAGRLGVGVGDFVTLRVYKPDFMPRDTPLTAEDTDAAFTLKIESIVEPDQFGDFALTAQPRPPANVFVSLKWLSDQLGLSEAGKPSRVSTTTHATATVATKPVTTGAAPVPAANLLVTAANGSAAATAALSEVWQLADAGLKIVPTPAGGQVELRSRRVFLEEPVTAAAAKLGGSGVMTYFVNELRVGSHATPYSMVTGLGDLSGQTPKSIPPSPEPGKIVLTDWVADDLAAKVGDTVTVKYWALAEGNRLDERSAQFEVSAIIPLADRRDLMPDYPGLANVENCRDWKPGVHIDLKRIRPKDEAYWTAHRGTPKAYISLADARRLWGNRFGDLTAIRFDPAADAPRAQIQRVQEFSNRLRAALSPESMGLHFTSVGALAGGEPTPANDFGQLFLGLSFFLIISAMLLTGLLYVLSMRQRAAEVGTLLAVGIPLRQVRRWLLAEGLILAAVGGVLGSAGGVAYARLLVSALGALWRPAVGASDLTFHASPASMAIGAGSAVVLAALTMTIVLWRFGKLPARQLLAGGLEEMPARARRRLPMYLAVGACVLCLGGLVATWQTSTAAAAFETFLGLGFFVLMVLLTVTGGLLVRRVVRTRHSVWSIGWGNARRRRGRSLAVVALLASGCFLVVAVGANRTDPGLVSGPHSGTGGFALWAEATIPVTLDFSAATDLAKFGVPKDLIGKGADVVPIRVHPGDDASCLNPGQPRRPRIIGVPSRLLRGRFRFTGGVSSVDLRDPGTDGSGRSNAVADETTLTWSLHTAVGQRLTVTNEQGRPWPLRIVAALENSVLQGSVIIDETEFVRLFPSEGGYRMFLIDVPPARADEVAASISQRQSRVGIEVVSARQRLEEFASVENTYLSIFLALGALGMLLGSAGMGVVVLRNVLERRGELALLRAVGFSRGRLLWVLLSEHCALVGLGVAIGALAAGVAMIPAFQSGLARATLPPGLIAVAAVAVAALGWTTVAAWAALRGQPLTALRNE